MAEASASQRPRFTIVELGVASAVIALLALFAIPVIRDNGAGITQVAAEREVQEGVRHYYADTQAFPTYGPRPGSDLADPWQGGSLPPKGSAQYAGINFDATAIKLSTGQAVRLYPDYVREKPKYAGDLADDATRRWRVDADGNVQVRMDGRSY